MASHSHVVYYGPLLIHLLGVALRHLLSLRCIRGGLLWTGWWASIAPTLEKQKSESEEAEGDHGGSGMEFDPIQ